MTARRQLLIALAAATIAIGATMPIALWRRRRRRTLGRTAAVDRKRARPRIVPLAESEIGPARDLAG